MEVLKFKLQSNFEKIPPLSPVVIKVLDLVMREDVDTDQLSKLIESDPMICAKVIELVQRASVGIVSKAHSVSHAITILGLDLLKYALLGIIIDNYSGENKIKSKKRKEIFKNIWAHSLATAIASSLIARKCCPEYKSKSFIAGLLHDIGKIGLCYLYPEEYRIILDQILFVDDFCILEKKKFGTDHGICGVWMAEKQNFPEELVEVIQFHHLPLKNLEEVCSENFRLLTIVKLADILAHEMFLEFFSDLQDYRSILKFFGLNELEIDEIQKELKEEYHKRSVIFKDCELDLENFVDEARKKLSNIAVELELRNRNKNEDFEWIALYSNFADKLIKIKNFSELFVAFDNLFQSFPIYKTAILSFLNEKKDFLYFALFQKGKQSKDLSVPLNEREKNWKNKELPSDIYCLIDKLAQRLEKKKENKYNEGIVVKSGLIISYLSCIGEICLIASDKNYILSEKERKFWQRVSIFVSKTIERLFLVEKLKTRTEKLITAIQLNKRTQQKMFELEKFASIGELAAMLAHEINNPLTVIGGYIQMWLSQEKDTAKIKYYEQILQQIEKITGILKDLMNFAIPREFEKVPLNIIDLLQRVIAFLKDGFSRKNIEIEFLKEDKLPSVLGDPSFLEQVFFNILLNAKQAIEEKMKLEKEKTKGKIVLSVSTNGIQKNDKYIEIKIKDNGCGIPANIQKKVFEPFFTTKKNGKGTGLGLSVSKSIIQKHKGTITIKSEEEKGTEVIIRLPVGS